MSNKEDLPSNDSPNLALLEQTPEEKIKIWKLNGQIWRGRLSLENYIRREEHLADQAFTRNGGIAYWVLTDSTKPPNERPILSSCESLRKRAFVKRIDGVVEEVISHGVGSVFCDPSLRSRGYARRMVVELGKKLDYWSQEEGRSTDFTVLYSDIGKTFYSKSGWEAFTSSHITLRPQSMDKDSVLGVTLLTAEHLGKLCIEDERLMYKALETSKPTSNTVLVGLIPDVATMAWHHAREEFLAQELVGRVPRVKGAYSQCNNGSGVWCVWSRFFGNTATEGNVLNILRMVVEGEQGEISMAANATPNITQRPSPNEEHVKAVMALLRAAQSEAKVWDMNDIQVWNPSPAVVAAVNSIEPSSQVIYRDEESIASLKWHRRDPKADTTIGWVANEKYGWC